MGEEILTIFSRWVANQLGFCAFQQPKNLGSARKLISNDDRTKAGGQKMPVVVIHLSPETRVSDGLAKEVHEVVADVLGISGEHAYVMVYNSASTRWVHESCDANFVFVEIFMFSGRSDEVKERLFSRLTEIIVTHTKVDGKDVLLNVIESDRNNWSRDGIQMSKLE